jgi:hypothetical protein
MSYDQQLCQKSEVQVVTVLGYTSKPTPMGCLRWLKRIIDYIEQTENIFALEK